MNAADLTAKLVAGGVPAHELSGDTDNVSPYCTLLDPAGAETVGRALADEARALEPTKILVWEDPDVNVLGHIVSRELGITAARALEASGVLDLDGAITGSDRVVVVADAVRRPHHARAMRALSERDGGHLAGFVVLVSTPALRESTRDAEAIALLDRARSRTAQ